MYMQRLLLLAQHTGITAKTEYVSVVKIDFLSKVKALTAAVIIFLGLQCVEEGGMEDRVSESNLGTVAVF